MSRICQNCTGEGPFIRGFCYQCSGAVSMAMREVAREICDQIETIENGSGGEFDETSTEVMRNLKRVLKSVKKRIK